MAIICDRRGFDAQSHRLLRARRRVIHLFARAFEPALEGQRILAEVVHEARERGRVPRPEFLAPCAGRVRDRDQMLGQRLPKPLFAVLKRVRVEDAVPFPRRRSALTSFRPSSHGGRVPRKRRHRDKVCARLPRERGVQTAKAGRHSDGDGLHLVVKDTGRRTWVLRYQMSGVRRDKGLGSYPEVGLRYARSKAAADRALIARGLDPIEEQRASRKAAKPVPTFGDIAQLVIADAQSKSSNAKVQYQWKRHLGEAYSGPLLERPVHEITDRGRCRRTVPLVNLKDRKHRAEGFRVPLIQRSAEIVRQMHEGRLSGYIFPGQVSGKPLSNIALLRS